MKDQSVLSIDKIGSEFALDSEFGNKRSFTLGTFDGVILLVLREKTKKFFFSQRLLTHGTLIAKLNIESSFQNLTQFNIICCFLFCTPLFDFRALCSHIWSICGDRIHEHI